MPLHRAKHVLYSVGSGLMLVASTFQSVACMAVLWEVFLFVVKGGNSVILEFWAAPGAPKALPKGGVLRPLPFGRVSGAPGAAQTPKLTDFRSLQKFSFNPRVFMASRSPRRGLAWLDSTGHTVGVRLHVFVCQICS